MTRPNNRISPIEAVIETAIYAADLGAAEAFYTGVLGLPVIGREAGRHVFFRVGAASVLLVFNPDVALAGGQLPPHGSRGSGHFAIGVRPRRCPPRTRSKTRPLLLPAREPL